MKFQDLSLPEEIHKALVSMDFSTPTEIQEKAIPLAITGKDIIAGAQTGTGVTTRFTTGPGDPSSGMPTTVTTTTGILTTTHATVTGISQGGIITTTTITGE